MHQQPMNPGSRATAERRSNGSRRRAVRLRAANRHQRHESLWLGITALACLLLLGVVIGHQVLGGGADRGDIAPSEASVLGGPPDLMAVPGAPEGDGRGDVSQDGTTGEAPSREAPAPADGPQVPIII